MSVSNFGNNGFQIKLHFISKFQFELGEPEIQIKIIACHPLFLFPCEKYCKKKDNFVRKNLL